MPSASPTLREIKQLLSQGAVRDALALLNQQTAYRFTALYRFDGDTLHNVVLYDREDPSQVTMPDIPVLASYCVFVRDSGAAFRLEDSHDDARVAGHPRQHQIRSYCGVPLLDDAGRMFGTLCHFDFRPLPVSDGVIETMESIAPAVQRLAA